jgi:hypothetical protein
MICLAIEHHFNHTKFLQAHKISQVPILFYMTDIYKKMVQFKITSKVKMNKVIVIRKVQLI